MPAKTTEGKEAIEIKAVERGFVKVAVLGTTPLICNRVSEKTKQYLLAPPGGKKTAAEKQSSLKHQPLEEFRNSPYTLADQSAPTLLAALSVWFKRAMMTAALDLPGAKKAQVGRVVFVEGERIPLYGMPQMFMAVTRSADQARTPDIRTRCIVPRWATILTIGFQKPLVKEKAVLNLLAAAGPFCGVGDWRTEKGSGNFGSFELVGADDRRLAEVMAYGRTEQIAAMNSPSFYDDETESLYKHFLEYAKERDIKAAE